MQTYICLMNLTAKGAAEIKEAPQRVGAAIKLAESMGGKVKDVFVTMGDYDYVAIGEFPNDEAALTFLLALGAAGNVRTKTLKAYTPEQFAGAVGKLP